MRAPVSASGLFPILLLVALGALTLWLERATQLDNGQNNGKFRHDPDFMVENFTVRRFAADGMLQNTLTARKMVHFPDDDSTDVDAPRVLFNRGPQPVRLSSNTAWVSKDGKEVKLKGDVRYIRPGLNGAPETAIATAEMTLLPDDELAHSDVPVTITQGQTIVTGSGLDADNKAKLATLRGPVRGIIYNNKLQSNQAAHETTSAVPPPVNAASPSPSRATAAPAARPAGARGKGRSGKAGKSRSRQNHRR